MSFKAVNFWEDRLYGSRVIKFAINIIDHELLTVYLCNICHVVYFLGKSSFKSIEQEIEKHNCKLCLRLLEVSFNYEAGKRVV